MGLTKTDIKNLKTEFKKEFATKKDIDKIRKEFATKKELLEFKNDMVDYVDTRLNEFEERVDEKIGNLPTKEEFYGAMDELMKEVKAMWEEQTTLGAQVRRNEDDIASLKVVVIN